MPISEKTFQARVVNLARKNNWRVGHFHDSRKQVYTRGGKPKWIGDLDAKGIPDLLMVRDGRLIFAELKSDKGRLTNDQKWWIADLEKVEGIEVYVWRPRDWEAIKEIIV